MTEDQPAGSVHSDDPGSNGSPTGEDAARRPSADGTSADLTRREPTTDSPVAAAVARLDELGGLSLHEHPDLYQAMHADLQDALAAIDDA